VARTPSGIDLILMDIDLGKGMGGTEAARLILASNDIPILFLSSHTEPDIVTKTEEITNYGYVVKSSTFTVLDASIKMALKLFAAKRQLDLSSYEIETKSEELRRNNEALRKTNRELAQSEDKFSKAFHTNPDSININRLSDGLYIDINEGFTRIMGYTREDAIGRSSLPGDLGIWVREEDRRRLLQGLLETGEVENLEAEFRKKDGSTTIGLMSARVLEIGGERCIISITRDMGEWKRTQDELREVEQKFRLAFEKSPIGIALTTIEGRLRTVNHAFCDMIGYSMLEVNAADFSDFTYPDDRASSDEMQRRLLDGSSDSVHFTKRFIHKDGHVVWAEVSTSVAGGETGRPGFFVSHITNVTRDRSASERFRLAMDATSDGIWDRDIPAGTVYYSPAYYKMLDYEEGELDLARKNWLLLVHPDDRDRVEKANEDCTAGLIPDFDIEFRMRAKPGAYKWVRSRGGVVERDEAGRSIRILGTHVDITERKRDELKFRGMFSEHGAVMLLYEPVEGRIVDANASAAEFYGYSLDELRSMRVRDIHTLDDRQIAENIGAALANAFKARVFRHRLKNGDTRYVEVYGSPITIDDRTFLFSIIHDITEKKRADDLVKKLLDEKELILKEVHHRIKNNMSAVQSFLALQASGEDEPAAVAALEEAAARIRSMGALYDRLYQGGDYESLSLRDYVPALAKDIVGNFPNRDSVELRIEVGDFRLGPAVLQPLGIILNELLTNAMKYAFAGRTAGSIDLSIRREGSAVRLELRDDGVGIPEGVDFGTSTGFGLTLVAALTLQLAGTIAIGRGEGTRISLSFESA
ncbi:MAG: PAS domain S-box protein, partial [Treponema sp.]|nr:PAS domain S-box protein [Treponema sp.]